MTQNELSRALATVGYIHLEERSVGVAGLYIRVFAPEGYQFAEEVHSLSYIWGGQIGTMEEFRKEVWGEIQNETPERCPASCFCRQE